MHLAGSAAKIALFFYKKDPTKKYRQTPRQKTPATKRVARFEIRVAEKVATGLRGRVALMPRFAVNVALTQPRTW